MRNKGSASIIILAILLTLAATAGIAYYLGASQGRPQAPSASPTSAPAAGSACPQDAQVCPDGTSVGRIGPDCKFAPCPTSPSPTPSSLKPGWQVYQNAQPGFSISYPANFQVLDDPKNLYGWPHAIVLLYSGGQSYDLPIEVWNTAAEYEAKYKNASNLTVKEVNGKFVTLTNSNNQSIVDQIIATFTASPSH